MKLVFRISEDGSEIKHFNPRLYIYSVLDITCKISLSLFKSLLTFILCKFIYNSAIWAAMIYINKLSIYHYRKNDTENN